MVAKQYAGLLCNNQLKFLRLQVVPSAMHTGFGEPDTQRIYQCDTYRSERTWQPLFPLSSVITIAALCAED